MPRLRTELSRRDFLKFFSSGLTVALAGGPLDRVILGTEKIAGEFGGFRSDYPLVIKKARSFVGGSWRTPDIGITEAGTLIIGETPLSGESVIQAEGRVVSPGFIDILADNSSAPEKTFGIFEKYKLTDGVTTALQMHGGSEKAGAYYDHFSRVRHWANYGVSTKVMRIRQLVRDRNERCRMVERCLDEGALGVSHSLEYQPDTTWEELLGYARLAKKYDRPLFLHLRYSSEEKELEGVEEAVELARSSGARLHIDHLNSTGGSFHMAEALKKIRAAVRSGLEITTCVYPYSYWATYLDSERFSPGWQERYHLTFSDLELVGTGERLTQESFERYRRQKGVLAAVPAGTIPLEETVNLALQEDFCLVASDGGIESEPKANNHPRGAGCFATAIRHALSIGMPLEKMLEKMTVLPGRVLRPALDHRGILEDGAVADLTVFDPGTVDGAATIANPNQFSKGIETVIVKGKVAYRHGELVSRNGVEISYRPDRAA
ncbi:MAG: nitrate reductase [Candidatus Aminicenantes bacterium RBG_13_63_10]|nr:MAG: nitrate reductase [Candidatus Aminicenantes bacterium RBG_13_63_10]